MDVGHPALVAATADRGFHVFDLTAGLSKQLGTWTSDMAYQTRCVSIFADKTGFAAGCIEGRVSIEYFDEMGTGGGVKPKKFMFKCHRIKTQPNLGTNSPCDIYGVNAIAFNHLNTFVTGGSDGNMVVWDKDNRSRITGFDMFE